MLQYITWNIDPEIINLFGISIRYYGLLFVGGLYLGIRLITFIGLKEKVPVNHIDKLVIHGFVGILVGARLGHCLFYEPEYFLAHPLEMFFPIRFNSGEVEFIGYQGLASHGGALGLILSLILYAWKTKEKVLFTLDLIAMATPLVSVFIRLANLMNSEIIGLPTSKPWGFIFTQVDNLPRHPAQLFEAMAYFLILIIIHILYWKRWIRLGNGIYFGLVIFLTFTARFFIELIKENQVAFEAEMSLNMGQLLSLPYVLFGILAILFGAVRAKRQTLSA